MIRFYPDREGYTDSKGVSYPDYPSGEIRPELEKYIGELKNCCVKRNWEFIVESLNHGTHTVNSMHMKGLAIDFNCYKITEKVYCSFEEQKEIAIEATNITGFNVWCWADDLNTHTHCSVHP